MSNRLAALILLLLPVALTGPAFAQENGVPKAKRRKADESKRAPPTFALAKGQAIVGVLAEKRLTVLTRYGKLTVPFEEIVRVRFHPRLSPQDTEKLATLITALREDGDDEWIAEAIAALGRGAYLLITEARKLEENKEIDDSLGEIQEGFEAIEGIYLDHRDEIVTQRFTIKGQIVDETLRVERGRLKLTIPLCDIRHIAYGDLEIRKVFKVNAQHIEGSNGLLDTGIKVKKNQRFSLSPTGTMTWKGQTFGPAGISNHTWNSRKMGSLQWRIGKGPWKMLPSAFEGKADAAGNIAISVHLTGGGASGEFKVEFKLKKK
jgi:hypothetical protein